MEPKLVGGNFGEQTGARLAFINRLVWLLGGEHLPPAFLTRIFKYDVLDVFKESLNEFELVGNIEAYYLSCLATTRARELAGVSAVLNLASLNGGRRTGSTAAVLDLWNDVQSIFFGVKLIGRLTVNGLTRAGQKSGIDFCRFLAEDYTIASAELFFELSYASEQFFDEGVAIIQIIRKEIRRIQIVSGWLFRHWFVSCC
jgi:hypothetical protein